MPKPEMHKKARFLRKEQTYAEALLWSKIRSRQLSGVKFRRQHPLDQYILDFYCREAHLAVEIDGGQHADPKNISRDSERTKYLNEKGIKVIRFWNNDVLNNLDDVLTEIDAVLREVLEIHSDQ